MVYLDIYIYIRSISNKTMESLRGETSMSELSVQDTKKMRKTAAIKIIRKTCRGPKELFLPQILVACTSNKIVFTWNMWYTLWKMHFWMYLIRCVQCVRSVSNIHKCHLSAENGSVLHQYIQQAGYRWSKTVSFTPNFWNEVVLGFLTKFV